MGLRTIIFLFSLTWLANCGGTATQGVISITPYEPFVLVSQRKIPVITSTGIEYITFDAPNIAFKIKINNAGNPDPLTILGLALTVDGPRGTKIVTIDPSSNLFKLNGSNFSPDIRIFFAEVPPYQASYCMDKVNFFKEPDASRTCADIASDLNKIPDHGVSAANTVPNATDTACCPTTNSVSDLENTYILIGGLQDYGSEAIIPTPITLSVAARFQGFYGTFAEPISNYSSQVNFSARAN